MCYCRPFNGSLGYVTYPLQEICVCLLDFLTHVAYTTSVIFVLIYFLVLVFQLFFSFF